MKTSQVSCEVDIITVQQQKPRHKLVRGYEDDWFKPHETFPALLHSLVAPLCPVCIIWLFSALLWRLTMLLIGAGTCPSSCLPQLFAPSVFYLLPLWFIWRRTPTAAGLIIAAALKGAVRPGSSLFHVWNGYLYFGHVIYSEGFTPARFWFINLLVLLSTWGICKLGKVTVLLLIVHHTVRFLLLEILVIRVFLFSLTFALDRLVRRVINFFAFDN